MTIWVTDWVTIGHLSSQSCRAVRRGPSMARLTRHRSVLPDGSGLMPARRPAAGFPSRSFVEAPRGLQLAAGVAAASTNHALVATIRHYAVSASYVELHLTSAFCQQVTERDMRFWCFAYPLADNTFQAPTHPGVFPKTRPDLEGPAPTRAFFRFQGLCWRLRARKSLLRTALLPMHLPCRLGRAASGGVWDLCSRLLVPRRGGAGIGVRAAAPLRLYRRRAYAFTVLTVAFGA